MRIRVCAALTLCSSKTNGYFGTTYILFYNHVLFMATHTLTLVFGVFASKCEYVEKCVIVQTKCRYSKSVWWDFMIMSREHWEHAAAKSQRFFDFQYVCVCVRHMACPTWHRYKRFATQTGASERLVFALIKMHSHCLLAAEMDRHHFDSEQPNSNDFSREFENIAKLHTHTHTEYFFNSIFICVFRGLWRVN